MSDVLKRRRNELGLSQSALAALAGIDARQIRRYEAGDQQPLLPVAVAIAEALGISVGELAGIPHAGVTLTGDWWASWQTYKDGQEVITAQEIRLRQQGELVHAETTTRGIAVEDGGYHWRGELRLWDNELLLGWYAATDNSVRSKGTMYFVLHPHGQHLNGRWVGMSHDGQIITGAGGIAHTEHEARAVIEATRETSSTP